ncbi:hypothetical protein KSP40_PGU010638 [Platanthera guangdongensis]|uniref:Uncharacterized protein n=1 Tax=Platanthera guangdongensis TaxID=2320717 RepID=A0ABR2N4S9_9ASPA
MAALLPNPKNLSAHSLLDFRSLLPHSSPRLTLATRREKPIRVSSILFRRRRERGISFSSRPRRWTVSTTSAVHPENVKEDCNEEEEDEDFVPLREMKRWLQNKPAGFGEGKTYDTTAEEKILEEFEQSTKNQPAKKKKPLVSVKENAGSVGKQAKQKEEKRRQVEQRSELIRSLCNIGAALPRESHGLTFPSFHLCLVAAKVVAFLRSCKP